MNERIVNEAAPGRTRMTQIQSVTPTSGAQQQIKLLSASNACLRRNLVRFSRGLKQVGHLAYHDELTGLPNRSLLLDRLRQAMQQAVRQQKLVLLLFVDLDRFKWINGNLGVAVGDRLLKQVALRLAASIRGGDTACRYGGDEFVLMLPEIEGKHSAAAVVNKIRAQLAVPYVIDDRMITLRASVGVILYRDGEQNGEDLIQQAESNMRQQKAHCKSPILSIL